MMLAGAANASGGTVNMLGAGWQVRPSAPVAPVAVVVMLRIPRRQAGVHKVRLELLDHEGEPVTVSEADDGPLVAEEEITVTGLQDRGLRAPLVAGLALNLPPFPLDPGREYQWRLHVDGKTRSSWTLPFRTTFPDEEQG
jgi:hypothetical protein